MSKLSRGSCRSFLCVSPSDIRRLLWCSWYGDAEGDAVAGWGTGQALEETEHSSLDSSCFKLNHSSLTLTTTL